MTIESKCREEFERVIGGEQPSKILWRRGGGAFDKDVSKADYADRGIRDQWWIWQRAWDTARKGKK